MDKKLTYPTYSKEDEVMPEFLCGDQIEVKFDAYIRQISRTRMSPYEKDEIVYTVTAAKWPHGTTEVRPQQITSKPRALRKGDWVLCNGEGYRKWEIISIDGEVAWLKGQGTYFNAYMDSLTRVEKP